MNYLKRNKGWFLQNLRLITDFTEHLCIYLQINLSILSLTNASGEVDIDVYAIFFKLFFAIFY